MTLPSLPTRGSTNWFPWAQAVHNLVQLITGKADLPSGGSDGQALVKAGTGIAWGAPPGSSTVSDAAMAAAYGPSTGAKVAADPLLKAAYGLDPQRANRDAALRPWEAQVTAGSSQTYILGHSVVAGSGTSSPEFTFPSRVREGIQAIDPAATVTIDGHGGYTSAQLLGVANALTAFASAQGLVLFMGLLNDYQTGVAPATSQSNLAAIVARFKALQPAGAAAPSFVILTEWLRGDVTSPAYPWTQYVAAAQAVAADPTVTVLDLGTRLGPPTSDQLGLFSSDHVHPTNSGHALIARLVTSDILSTAVGQLRAVAPSTFIPVITPPVSQTNWPFFPNLLSGTNAYGNAVLDSDGTQGARIAWQFTGLTGHYTILLAHRAGSNRGKYDFYIDGSLQGAGGSIDGYAASVTDRYDSVPGFYVPSSGLHTIEFRMTSKNASSTGYTGSLSAVGVTRTGA